LNQLGYDAGPEDGLWGKRTKAAALAIRTESPKLTNNPYLNNLTRASAISWCREVGTTHFAVRKHQPSIKEAEFHFGPEITSIQRNMVQSAARTAWAFLKSRLKFEMASRIDVVAGRDPRQIARDLKTFARKRGFRPFPDQRQHVKTHCADVQRWTALTYTEIDFVLVCANPSMTADHDWQMGHRALSKLFVHEFVHSFQAEHSLAKTHPDPRQRSTKLMGPGWMIEGAAMVAELEYLSPGLKKFGVTTIVELLAPARTSDLRLNKIKKAESTEEYEVALFAVFLLAKRESVNRVMDYWRLLGQGKSQEQAFDEIFGMSLAEFETLFQKMRQDLWLSLDFTKGKN